MSEQEKIISSAEVQKGEVMITPEVRAISAARAKIMESREFLLAAGISEDLIEKAIDKVGEITAEKYARLEKEDPLILISQIFENIAQTDDEKVFFAEQDKINRKQMENSFSGNKGRDRAFFGILDRNRYRSDPSIADRSDSIAERILSKLGVLEEGKGLKVLLEELKKSLPKSVFALRPPDSYYSDHPTDDILTNLPTNLPGVFIDVWASKKDGRIHINGQAIESAVRVLEESYS